MRKGIVIFIIGLFICISFYSVVGFKIGKDFQKSVNDESISTLTKYEDFKKWNEIYKYNSFLTIESFFKPFNKHLTNEVTEQYSSLYSMGNSVKETSDGGFIICGYTGTRYSPTGFLLKTDSQGYMIWNKTIIIKGNTICYSVEQTIDNGYIITGGTINTFNNNVNAFLLKTDNMGNIIWNKTYDVSGPSMGRTVKQNADGEFIISGITISEDLNDYDAFLLKTDVSGEEIWVKKYEYNVFLNDFDQTTDGGYIIGGTIAESLWESKYFAFLLKTDEYGNEIWNKTFSITNRTVAYSVLETKDSGFILGGYSDIGGYLLKTNNKGVEIWNQSYSDRFCISVEQTSDNHFVTSGGASVEDKYHAFLLETNEVGIKIWDKTYKVLEETLVNDFVQTKQGEFVLTGVTSESIVYNDSYILLLKTDSKGDQQWYRTFNLPGVPSGYVKFFGWDISNSTYEVYIKIGGHGYSHGSSKPLGYYETPYFELFPGFYLYEVSWSGKESKTCTAFGNISISSNEYKEILQNLTFSDDNPDLTIIKPDKAIYVNNKKIIPFFTPVILGDIDILVNASDNTSGIDYVEFYIDDELKFNDSMEPFIWQWNEKSFGLHTIKIVAVDKVGYDKSYDLNAWKFL